MIYSEPVYDLRELARYNLHVHTTFSRCAKPDELPQDIVREADRLGLDMIALTDHYNDPGFDRQYMAQIDELKRAVASVPHRVKVLFSSELSGCGIGKWLENDDTNRALDYRLYSCNHFHIKPWDHPDDKSPRGYAEFAMAIIRSVVETGRADCIAHPLIARFVKLYDDRTLVTKSIRDDELYELSLLLKRHGTAWEINVGAVLGDPEFGRRLFNIGREAGATFHFGTDCHTLSNLDTRAHLDELEKILY